MSSQIVDKIFRKLIIRYMMEQTNSEDNLGVDGHSHDSDLSKEKVSEVGEDKAKTLQQSTGQYYNLVNKSMRTEFLEDQIREDNFTDLDIICSDGYVQVHRCLLMGASPLLRELLIDKGIADTTAITLPDVSVCLMRHVLSLLYSGRTIISKGEEEPVFNLMTMLQFPVNDLVYRTAMEADFQSTTVLRLMDFPGQVEEGDYQCGDDDLEDSINQGQDMQEDYQKDNGNDIEMKVDEDPEAETSAQTVICSPEANGEETIKKTGVGDTISEEPSNISDTEKRKRELESGDEENSREGIGRRLRKSTKMQSETTPSKLVNLRVRKAIQRNKIKRRPSKISSDQKETISDKSPPPLQRRLSSTSSVSSNGGYLNLTRVFLETKKYGGILYNIYGFMDPVKGIQSGKTIAVNAETDNSVDRNS